MSSAADIDALFTSGCTLATDTVSAPCDFYSADAVEEGEGGYGGTLLNGKTVLVRTSAFPDLDEGVEVTLTDDEGNATQYVVRETPRKIQDGQVMEVRLQVPEEE